MLKLQHTILAVDDEPANLRMLERLLRSNYKVLKAENAEDALKILQRENVSLIMTDQRMPGMSGTELLRKSRALNPDIVHMVVTGNTDSETFIDAIKNAGAIRVINKPWDPDKVLQMVQMALEKYEVLVANKQAISQLKQTNQVLDRMSKNRS
ncbi:MAG TPA: response regulator [Blastocatellia bacterium]|nr:response regulator [Blastocatellia bacterium]